MTDSCTCRCACIKLISVSGKKRSGHGSLSLVPGLFWRPGYSLTSHQWKQCSIVQGTRHKGKKKVSEHGGERKGSLSRIEYLNGIDHNSLYRRYSRLEAGLIDLFLTSVGINLASHHGLHQVHVFVEEEEVCSHSNHKLPDMPQPSYSAESIEQLQCTMSVSHSEYTYLAGFSVSM